LTNTASTGLIFAQDGVLRFDGGLSNLGSMAISLGTANVFGDITNIAPDPTRPGGTIVVSGNGSVNFIDDVMNNGLLQVSSGSTAVFFGAYSGTSVAGAGDVFMEGDLRPGVSPAEISFGGNLFFGAVSRLESEIGGTTPGADFDRVVVAGQVTFGGTLDAVFINLFTPVAGQRFEIMSFGSRNGEFATINGAGFLDNQTFLLPLYTGTDLTLRGFIPGDGNLNDMVDAGDYTVWANGFGMAGPEFTDGDYNGNGIIEAGDFTLWANNFGETVSAPLGAAAAVPEPSTIVLSTLGFVGLLTYRWRRRRRA
jgi:hypothetical protein